MDGDDKELFQRTKVQKEAIDKTNKEVAEVNDELSKAAKSLFVGGSRINAKGQEQVKTLQQQRDDHLRKLSAHVEELLQLTNKQVSNYNEVFTNLQANVELVFDALTRVGIRTSNNDAGMRTEKRKYYLWCDCIT